MPLIYRHLRVDKPDTAALEAKTHYLTFREVAAQSGPMPGGDGASTLTLALTESEASAYELGVAYEITLSPAKE